MVRLTNILTTIIALESIQTTACTSRNRRILHPKDNVGEIIRQSRNPRTKRGRDTIIKDRFTIRTKLETAFGEDKDSELAIDVVEAINPAVTLDTLIMDGRGNEFTVQESEDVILYSLLVSDIETADGADTFALLAINPNTNDMHGLVEKRARQGDARVPFKVKQLKSDMDGAAIATFQEDLMPPDWHCDVTEEMSVEDDLDVRRLMGDTANNTHGHHHHSWDKDDNVSVMKSLIKSVEGIHSNPFNKPRHLQSVDYKYQVDMFIEIDNAFINSLGNLNSAINYVNTLVTGANVIFESEIDTHLRVVNIVVSSLYDDATSSSDALRVMRMNYAGEEWHSKGVDLHHAFLGSIGGGIAYIGVLCRPDFGFGLTGGIKGNFESLNQPVVWDMKSFMHEIGHSFGSGHTHDKKYYDPIIDGCGISCPSSAGSSWSTLMSYCQWCPGSYHNIMYSFGGYYDGSGDKNDLSNWRENLNLVSNYNLELGHKSFAPNREAHKMFLHVSSMAQSGCVDLPSPIHFPPVTTIQKPHSNPAVASYDLDLSVPKCSKNTFVCKSGHLLQSRNNIGGVSEPNGDNTLDSCTDGSAGYFHSDESVDYIRIISLGGTKLQTGVKVRIVAKVWAYSSSHDFVDFYHANDSTKPEWKFIKTVKPTSSGVNTISTTHILGNGSLQAVRVIIRYNGVASPCPGGSYDDVDDLAFVVGLSLASPIHSSSEPTHIPTPLPRKKPSQLPTRKPTQNPTKKVPEPTPVSAPSPKSGK